jgi:hypothetical protein
LTWQCAVNIVCRPSDDVNMVCGGGEHVTMQRQRTSGAVGPVFVASFLLPGRRQSVEFSVVGRCQSMLVEIGWHRQQSMGGSRGWFSWRDLRRDGRMSYEVIIVRQATPNEEREG